jgi:hypothetical protein
MAAAQATTALRATTNLEPSAALALVRRTCDSFKGTTSLRFVGALEAGAKVQVEQEHPDRLELSMSGSKGHMELCTFAATTTEADGQTLLQIGGLATYKTSQARLLYVIPFGPKRIYGFVPYEAFLQEVAAELRANDPSVEVSIDRVT